MGRMTFFHPTDLVVTLVGCAQVRKLILLYDSLKRFSVLRPNCEVQKVNSTGERGKWKQVEDKVGRPQVKGEETR